MMRRHEREAGIASQSGDPRRRLRIALDLHVADGIYQGSRTHCLELFSRVVACTPECDFVILLDRPAQLAEAYPSFALPNVIPVRMPHAPAPVRLLRQLPALVRRCGADLLYTQYIAPPFSPCPTMVTVHDILFEEYPQYFDRAFVMRSRILVRRSVRRSAEIFTVSEYSRRQIAARYGASPERIHLIANGVDERRFFPGIQGTQAVRAVGLVPGEYFLIVGRLEPRKNHAGMLRAWAALPAPRPRLAIVGQRHFGCEEALRLIETLQLGKDVVVLESISDADLPGFFRNSRGFLYCSWAEGFGMPVLEAMASGIPVVSSSSTALRETCGDAAILVDPANIAAIRDAVLAVDSQQETRRSLIEKGLQRVKSFSWERSAEVVRSILLRHQFEH